MNPSFRPLVLILAVSAVCAGTARGADDDWLLCGPGPRIPVRPAPEATQSGTGSGAMHLSADRADVSEDGVSRLTGNVMVTHGTRQLLSDELVYTSADEIIEATGNVQFWDEGMFVSGESARAEIESDIVTVSESATFVLEDEHGHGSAAEITATADERLTASDVTYTTCDPGAPDWQITAGGVEFDRARDVGTARDTWLEVGGLRVLYLPWISFPLSDRRTSGFLTPTWGVDESNGVDVTAPYYFNLAPNYDATLATRAMSERGVQAQGEFRFLSQTLGAGRTRADYLPHDRKFDDYRAAFDVEHQHRWTDRWSTAARLEWASDAEYFEDFGDSLSQSSRTHLPRRVDAVYRGDGWFSRIRFEDFLTVGPAIPLASRPYARVPQILLRSSRTERNRAVNFRAEAEFTYFEQDARTTGTRADLWPSVSYPIRAAGAFLVPKAALGITRYALDPIEGDAIEDDTPSRALPILSLDSGVFLERPLAFQGRNLTHTIEPRLYYLYVPFESQSHLPDFDTSRTSFSFAQLFRENRYAGRDRVGDANQLTLALTSRLLDDRSAEIARASIGQIRYFRDREVVLGESDEPETTHASDLVAEIEARVSGGWRLRAGLQYDPDAGRTIKDALNVRYQPNRRSVVNAAYRLVRDVDPSESIEQVDLSFAWPLGAQWRTVGRWSVALGEARSRTLEAFTGVEYESCCWGMRAVVSRFFRGAISDGGGDRYSTGVYVQVELKGLTGVGDSAEAFLRRSIPGYENEF